MSISEISAARADPPRSSARTSAMAACAFGPGADRMLSSSSSVRPLIIGTGGATASRSSPRSLASSSSQCRRPACTRVNGRRSSTTIFTRSGSSRITSARRICGIASRRTRTAPGSRRKMFVPTGMSASARISSTGTRAAPSTCTACTASRGVVRSQATPPARAPARSSSAPAHFMPRVSRTTRRRCARRTRCRATSDARLPRSASVPAVPCGETRPRRLLADDADGMLEGDAQLGPHSFAGEIEQGQDVRGGGPAPVDDEVRVLGRDLGAADSLAAQADLLDQPRRRRARWALPHETRRRERQRLGRSLLLQALLQIALHLHHRAPVQAQPAPDEDSPGWRLEGLVAEGARAGLELTQRAIGVEKVDGTHEVADPAVRAAGVHGQRSTDGGWNPDQALDAAQIAGGGLADESREAHTGASQGLLALELRAAPTALELEGDPAHAAIPHAQGVACADPGHRTLLALGEHEGVADVVDVLGHDENVRGAADAQGRMKTEGLLEPDFAPDLS